MKALEVRDLSFTYRVGGEKVLEGVNFSLGRGEALGIIGASGSGKSTLCLALSGIIPHAAPGRMEGEVLVLGRSTRDMSLPEIAQRCGMVFQDPETQLFLPRIRNELAFGPENLCRPRDQIRQIIHRVSGMTGTQSFLDRSPSHLSGGEQQSVALASVLALGPEIILLDEASSQLDEQGAARIHEIVLRLKAEEKTVVLVDHDLSRLSAADVILALDQGQVAAFGPRAEILGDKGLLETLLLGERG